MVPSLIPHQGDRHKAQNYNTKMSETCQREEEGPHSSKMEQFKHH